MDTVWQLLEPHIEGLKRVGTDRAKGLCPIHEDKDPSLSIHLTRGVWYCFGCGEGGTLRSLLIALGQPRSAIDRVLEHIEPLLADEDKRRKRAFNKRFERADPYATPFPLDELVLAAYDFLPTKLVRDGFHPALLHNHDVGFDRKAMRITFPIHDLYGALAGISGRTVIDEEPRYKLYMGGKWGKPGDFGAAFDEAYPGYDIEKGKFLWNAHRAIPLIQSMPADVPLVIVEGFKAGLWVIQAGFPTTVALMTAHLSPIQLDLIRRVQNPVVLFLDNNYAGKNGTEKAREKLKLTHRVYSVEYPEWANDSTQPDDIAPEEVEYLIEQSIRRRYGKRTRKA